MLVLTNSLLNHKLIGEEMIMIKARLFSCKVTAEMARSMPQGDWIMSYQTIEIRFRFSACVYQPSQTGGDDA